MVNTPAPHGRTWTGDLFSAVMCFYTSRVFPLAALPQEADHIYAVIGVTESPGYADLLATGLVGSSGCSSRDPGLRRYF